ncbi:cytochrome c biogenesis protein CcsA [Archaeoglobus neptunius]|uniref:cytochrome c biogenesis protein CcsA n=1 Tax=Archaeoglobus neptunius TaxID=2798580 RepID=UPI001928EE8E|nr:cytochrome c biogenesis protein CcsA [Archaeoglobus neptunius]
MELGNFLLLLSFLTCIASSLLFYGRRRLVIAENLLYASLSFLLASLVLLIYYFVTDNFQIWYVYANSDAGMPLIYKISAAWAGKEGSLLLWAFFNLFLLSIYLNSGKKDDSKAITAFIVTVFSAYLLLILFLVSNPFATLSYVPSNGYGLNPLLRTIEMAVHPPVVFLAYSLSTLLFAIHLSNAEKSYIVSRVTWLTLTLGIVIGGIWAYRTLGWGGFWGWDPVENASLLPWLTLTLYFHVKKNREFFAYATFTLVLLATFITRSGIISSVHSFGGEYSDYFYVVPFTASLVPVIRRAMRFGELKSVCFSQLPVAFSAMLIVVLLGTLANLIVKVEKAYYLVTFLPIFAVLASVAALKIRNMDTARKMLHFGMILLFVGSASVWLFEQHETVNLGKNTEFKLMDMWIGEDAEKFTVYSKISTPYGEITPKVLIYKIDREDRRVSTVSVISYPWMDHYFAITSFDLKSGSVTIEYYRVPLILAVWVGSALMIAGEMFRLRGRG